MAAITPDDIPEPDRAEGAPHPRDTQILIGQTSAESAFLEAFNGSRMHHAWMISGPRGVGKATLAWRIARFLLSQPETADMGMFGAPEPPATLNSDPNHPAVRRAHSLGEPRLFLCRRPWDEKAKRLKKDITVDEVRKLKSFFSLSAADGGWRVAIIDDVDQMNTSAANALLKVLEEPPEKTILLVISHQPARLLPTILSRCRTLHCKPLSPQDQAQALENCGYNIGGPDSPIAVLSGGSVGAALRLAQAEGDARYAALVALAASAPGLDRAKATAIGDKCIGAANAEAYDITLTLIDLLLNRLARFGALQPSRWSEAAPHEALMLSKLAPNAHAARKWANLAQTLSARVAHARAVNLDPSSVILDMLLKLDETARA